MYNIMLIIMFIKAFTSVILVVLNLYWQYDDLYWLCWCKDTFIMNKLVILGSLAFESEEKCFIIVMLQCYSVLFCPLWPCRPPGPPFVSIIRVWWCQPPPLNIRLMVTAVNGRTLHSHTSHLVLARWWQLMVAEAIIHPVYIFLSSLCLTPTFQPFL